MNENQRLQLQKMISENNVEDQTELIRTLKHSIILRSDINKLLLLKNKYSNNFDDSFTMEAMLECNFLFTYYTDIYNKIKKDEIDMSLLFKFIDVLESIEKGEKDQHEASFEVGNILKDIYIDSALKKADKLNSENPQTEEYRGPDVNISWKQFKRQSK
jgi:hypothetical protein